MLDDDNPSPSPITLKDKILGKLGMLLLCAVVIAVMSAAVWFVGQATGVDFYSWNRTTIGLGAALGVWAVMYRSAGNENSRARVSLQEARGEGRFAHGTLEPKSLRKPVDRKKRVHEGGLTCGLCPWK
jgi:uncharacterized YccA/Bax inhibitor family protein